MQQLATTLRHLQSAAALRLRALLGQPAGSSGSAEGSLPRPFMIFLLLFGAGMILISLIGEQGLLAYLRMQSDVTRLRKEVAVLETREGGLELRIQALRGNPDYIELMARKSLGLVNPSDRIYQLPLADK